MPADADGDGFADIASATDLQAINDAPSGRYELTADIDLAGVEWSPLGGDCATDPATCFVGTLKGNGYTISNLHIVADTDNLGLFGIIGRGGVVRDMKLLNVTIRSAFADHVGALAGRNEGIVVGADIVGEIGGDNRIGGVVGTNEGVVINARAAVAIIGHGDKVGGLVGDNRGGDIVNSRAVGEVEGGDEVGGLVGDNSGRIINSYATATVNGGDGGDNRGGLVGNNATGIVQNSYAMGAVAYTSLASRGGLVGTNDGGIDDSYAIAVLSGGNVGGNLVGVNLGGGRIVGGYANTQS